MAIYEYSRPVDLNDDRTDILVVGCIDNRFGFAYEEVAEQYAGNKKYDRVNTKGASKSIDEDGGVTLDNIQTGVRLHGVTEVLLFDHIQCGAYGGEEDPEEHHRKLKLARVLINHAIPNLTVKGFLFHGTHAELVPLHYDDQEIADRVTRQHKQI